MTKVELERWVKELEAQNARLISGIKTGRFTYWHKTYVGVELPPEVENRVTDVLRDLRSFYDCIDNHGEGSHYAVMEDTTECLAGVTTYVVRYTYSDHDGAYLEKAYKAIEVQ